MKKVFFAVVCAMMFCGMLSVTYAEQQDWRGGIRGRVHDAKQSIERGIERGTLTRHEAQKLNDELDGILRTIDRMKDDGLSQSERAKINHDLDRLDRDIAREKRDDDTREGPRSTAIRDRVRDAKQSIERGRKRGSLTRREARQLNKELDSIIEKVDRIERDLDRLERDIVREKRDDERRRDNYFRSY